MSRCFPFPPPGYERKLDDTDLLKKEKSKEKKHKKDKKDREKRDGKEKKHKEKKDKHKEKKKDKEKRVDPQFESQNGDPLLRNNEHNKPKDDSSGHKKSSLQPQNGDHKESLVRKETGQNEKMSVNRIMTESNVDRINKKSTLMVQDMINGKNTRERVKEKTENKYLKNGETVGSYNNLSTSNTPNVRIQHSSSEVKKRKDMEENGFYHENEPWPNKMVRPRSGILTENGLSQQSKSSKVNGTIASQPMSLISKKPPIATANHITNKPLSVSSTKPFLSSKKKESIRAPHPDSKSLKQILTVPELDQWSGLDSQDWLFSSKDDRHFKKKVGKDILQDNKEVEVWSEAKQLESVDVCALPYVIPY